MIAVFFLMLEISTAGAETNTESCKDIIQGYLTGQLSSGLGTYQVEVLRREFKSFTEHVEESIRVFKETVKSDIQKMRGIMCSSLRIMVICKNMII